MSWNQVVAQRIKNIIDEKQISQKELMEKAEAIGVPIKQATLSKLLNGKQMLTVEYLVIFSNILEVSVDLFFEEKDENIFLKSDTEGFVVNVKENIFKGYLGKYYVYFYAPSITEQGNILDGELELEEFRGVCSAKMKLYIGRRSEADRKSKTYYGQMIVSHSLNCAYLTLYQPDLGDFGSMVFRHRRFRIGELQVRLGLALTCSAGDFNQPTVHYMLLSRKEIDEEKLSKIANVHMRIGNDYCCISEADFERLREEFPECNYLWEQYMETRKFYYIADYSQVDKWIQLEKVSEGRKLDIKSRLSEYSFQKYNESLSNEHEYMLFRNLDINGSDYELEKA